VCEQKYTTAQQTDHIGDVNKMVEHHIVDTNKMITMAQQTAVEWLLENIQKVHKMDWDIVFVQAMMMEKEQMINAGNKCAQMHKEFVNMLDSLTTKELYAMEISTTTFGEQYYNETYKK
jgi:3-methyladenine DNA glycosylase AlkD